uniref:lens fiber membrane intrinsic protein-like n=1 Tax=Pristiophorus japonicus TaxID=55135 RepID=UPI00398F425B
MNIVAPVKPTDKAYEELCTLVHEHLNQRESVLMAWYRFYKCQRSEGASQHCYRQTDTLAYWNATRAFMILSAMSCFLGLIAGVLAFAHFSFFEKFNRTLAAGILFFISTFLVLLAMAVYTVNFLGKRFGDWPFSWSYILGWVAMLLTFFAGIFCMCAYRMDECRRMSGPR